MPKRRRKTRRFSSEEVTSKVVTKEKIEAKQDFLKNKELSIHNKEKKVITSLKKKAKYQLHHESKLGKNEGVKIGNRNYNNQTERLGWVTERPNDFSNYLKIIIPTNPKKKEKRQYRKDELIEWLATDATLNLVSSTVKELLVDLKEGNDEEE